MVAEGGGGGGGVCTCTFPELTHLNWETHNRAEYLFVLCSSAWCKLQLAVRRELFIAVLGLSTHCQLLALCLHFTPGTVTVINRLQVW